MTLLARRRVVRWLFASWFFSLCSVGVWIVHMSLGETQDMTQSQVAGEMAQQIRINTERIFDLRRRVSAVEDAHVWILWLLVGNLAAGLGSLSTYVITHNWRRRDDKEVIP